MGIALYLEVLPKTSLLKNSFVKYESNYYLICKRSEWTFIFEDLFTQIKN